MRTLLTLGRPVTQGHEAAREILRLHGELQVALNRSLENAIRIGELIAERRSLMERSDFVSWLLTHNITKNQARLYIRMYEDRNAFQSSSVAALVTVYQILAECGDDVEDLDVEEQLIPPQGHKLVLGDPATGDALTITPHIARRYSYINVSFGEHFDGTREPVPNSLIGEIAAALVEKSGYSADWLDEVAQRFESPCEPWTFNEELARELSYRSNSCPENK